jgi:hypothetical protein
MERTSSVNCTEARSPRSTIRFTVRAEHDNISAASVMRSNRGTGESSTEQILAKPEKQPHEGAVER